MWFWHTGTETDHSHGRDLTQRPPLAWELAFDIVLQVSVERIDYSKNNRGQYGKNKNTFM